MNTYSKEIFARLNFMKPAFGEMGLRRVRVFGSVARGEAGPDSDLDLLVDFETTPSLIGFISLKHNLEDRLGIRVDMVTPKGLHRALKDEILEEAVDV